jgi:hypothetical protein
MARLIGELRPDATNGEIAMLAVLSGLPEDYTIWPELCLGGEHDHSVDFVLFNPKLGVCVLEAKDWIEILDANPDWFRIRMHNGYERPERHPLKGAREKALAISDKLQHKPGLVHQDGPYRGKLAVPWAYAVAFPNLTRMMVYWLDDVLSDRFMICRDDLDVQHLERRLEALDWRFQSSLTNEQVGAVIDGIYPQRTRPEDLSPAQVDAVRAAVDPDLLVEASSGRELGVLDWIQETVAKEGVFEIAPSEDSDPDIAPEEREIARRLVVRLVRGVAGSGKTRVLITRAKHLARNHPDWRILAVTFNEPLARHLRHAFRGWEGQIRATHFHQICQEGLEANGLWRDPVRDREGRIAYILKNKLPEIQDQINQRFLSEEIAWMKDIGCIDHERYLAASRTGRGLPLQREERLSVLRVFDAYEQNLQRHLCLDWEDVPLATLDLLQDGSIPGNQYDAILIDEAQDFAPVWFEVLKRIVNPKTGVFFLAADATQRIYRRFTWRSMGMDVVGRSRVLSRSYRNTYEILRSAFELIRNDDSLQRQLADEEEELTPPELDGTSMRHGPYPELRSFDNVAEENTFLVDWIKRLLAGGYLPGEIAILHRKKFGPEHYMAVLRAAGIPVVHLKDEIESVPQDSIIVSTIHLAKGLEYRAVYIGQLQCLFKPDEAIPFAQYPDFRAKETRLLYVGLARARDRVCLTCQRQLPKELTAFGQFLAEVREGALA